MAFYVPYQRILVLIFDLGMNLSKKCSLFPKTTRIAFFCALNNNLSVDFEAFPQTVTPYAR